MNGFIRKMTDRDGKPRYYPVIKIDDKQKSLGGFKLKKDAEARLKRAEAELAAGTYGREELTFAAFYVRWIEAKETNLKPSTLRDVKAAFRVHILPALGDSKLSDLEPLDIQGFIDTLGKKGLSPATIGKIYRYLRSALRQAESWRLIDRAPTSGVILPRVNREELDFLPPEQVLELLEAARDPERVLFALQSMSGLRLGEGLALRWSDINFEMRSIMVTRSWSRTGGFHEPKTATSRRAVLLLDRLADILHDFCHSKGHPGLDDLLFTYDGKQPLDPGNTRRHFYRALEAAGLRHVTIHSLRHTFASVMLASGTNIKALQRSLGHSSATMTLDTYSHLLEESIEGPALRANQIFTGAEGKLVHFPRRKKDDPGENR